MPEREEKSKPHTDGIAARIGRVIGKATGKAKRQATAAATKRGGRR